MHSARVTPLVPDRGLFPGTSAIPRPALTEHEIDRTDQAEPRPEEVQLHRLLHVEHRKRDEHNQRDRFLQHLQLGELEGLESDAVRGALAEGIRRTRSPS